MEELPADHPYQKLYAHYIDSVTRLDLESAASATLKKQLDLMEPEDPERMLRAQEYFYQTSIQSAQAQYVNTLSRIILGLNNEYFFGKNELPE